MNYYKKNGDSIECIDYIESHNLGKGFNRGNIIKYVTRAGEKNKDTEIEDLEKALAYVNYELARLKNEKNI